MCFLCSQATGFETEISTIIGISETPKLEVNQTAFSLSENGTPATLSTIHIKEDSDYWGWQIVDYIQTTKDNVINYYIDTDGSSTIWNDTQVSHSISATSIPNYISSFIEESFRSLDEILDINFKRVENSEDATLRIIHSDMSSLPGRASGWEGFASTRIIDNYYDWGIEKWRATDLSLETIIMDDWFNINSGRLNSFQEHLILHELGHLLTLEHPFSDLDDDIYGTDYGSNAADISETLMAYESNNQAYSDWYTDLDIKALKEIWGENFAPTDYWVSSTSFNENIDAGSIIANLETIDQDTSDAHTYTLVAGDGDTDNDSFTIDGSSLKIKSSPDYEINSSYNIRIKTTDSGGLSYEKVINLSVNYIPQDISLSASSFNENIIAGSLVSVLTTTDQDASDSHTYTLVAGDGDTDNDSFTIDGSSLKIKSSPDYEINSSYNIRLQTTDSNGLSYEKAINLSVNDLVEFVPTILGTSNNDNLKVTTADDSIDGGAGIDTVTFTGKFSDYTFTRGSLIVSDQRSGINDGTDTLKNIEYLQFADQTVESSKVDVVKTYSGDFSDYKFFNRGNGVYEIETNSGSFDDITGYPLLSFTGESTTSSFRDISAIVDIKGTFDQVTGLNTDDAKMFRLYNASFKRLPDPDGLRYWIGKYSSGENDTRVVASSFLGSAEFKERYGENVSDTTYVNNLYQNVLGRDADTSGLNYWLGQLSSGAETRYEVLLGFAESAENKTLFTEMTGFG